ncbi:MAG: hypothetical protein ACREF7_01625, partial [Candidatus Saccharimonadales bacterium]
MHKSSRATLKINGQDYDAGSGNPIGQVPVNIDGVVLKPKPDKTHPIKHINLQPSPSQTLMRNAVAKPTKTAKLIESVNMPIGLNSKPPVIVSPPMVGRIDPNLAKRAKTFRPSSEISRFGASLRSAAAPTENPTSNLSSETISKRAQAIAKPAGASLLERAVDNAKSHELPKLSRKEMRQQHGKRKVRGRKSAVALVSLMGVMVIAYAIYVNMPNVMVKVASVRAGFSAVMPGYRP